MALFLIPVKLHSVAKFRENRLKDGGEKLGGENETDYWT